MSGAFTPGPWDWWDDGESLVRITDAAEQKLVAQAILPSNARLIAAAPELYEALLNLWNAVESYAPDLPGVDEAQAALAKARGE